MLVLYLSLCQSPFILCAISFVYFLSFLKLLNKVIRMSGTLPSSRRPPEVEEILKSESTGIVKRESLKIKVNLHKVFIDSMLAWCRNLGPKARKRLTSKKIVSRGVIMAYNLSLDYHTLPQNWLKTLYTDHGVLFKFSKTSHRTTSQKWPRDEPCDDGSLPPKKKTKFDHKKLIDLTDQPPPNDWIAAYSNNERVLPRTLKVYQTPEDVRIVYYDYSHNIQPENKRQECKFTQRHDRDGLENNAIMSCEHVMSPDSTTVD